ncbi:hypothetical protein Ppro_2201 [Pelobacter propionicus DSM 2379]|uniref:DUF3300 domain-containing protein n=2 Tax=Pelobacter propionicus TaxID=29543 RepID=A1AR38_PELPD|nr:hypothetical protein Ppro_2201 [Pelobacter propionicus DSM 2379]
MKRCARLTGMQLLLCLFLLSMPMAVSAETETGQAQQPPIGQQLVREGAFAIKLAEALEIVSTDNEVEAESKLAEVGIVPRNGWIADYPVTPDIIAELQGAVRASAEANKLHFEKDEALGRFQRVNQELSLGIRPYAEGDKAPDSQPKANGYPNPAVINNYYYQQGPPVVTYYTPPRDYYYLYSWIPSPFWSFGFWFPGFYVMNDFHLVVHGGYSVSNHYNDHRMHRVYRVDPRARYHGRTYGGIGVSRPRGFLSTGVPHSDRTIFNGSRNRAPSGYRGSGMPTTGGRTYGTAPRGSAPSFHRAPSGGSHRSMGGMTAPSRGGAPSGGGRRR